VDTGLPKRSCSDRKTEHDPEKWIPVFRKIMLKQTEHDPEKRIPVFRKDHAQTERQSMMRKNGYRFSGKITLKQKDRAG